MRNSFPNDRYTLAAIAVLVVFVSLVWSAASQKSETMDEGLFIAGGAIQAQHLNANVDLSHPPLLRWVAGIPATLMGKAKCPDNPPVVPKEAMPLETYKLQDLFDWSVDFFYNPEHDYHSVLFWGRFLFAFFGVIAGVLIFRELRKRFTANVAFLGLIVFLFTPEVLAHAQWAHSDLASACAILAASLALAHALEHPSLKADLTLGLLLGLAMLVKLTSGIIVPLALVLIACFHKGAHSPTRWKETAVRWIRVSAVIYVVLILGYLPDPRVLPPHEFIAGEDHWAARWLPLPNTLVKGLVYTKLLTGHGQVAFLHGEVRAHGWWYYFPVAMVLKYPTPLLLLGLAGLATTLRSTVLTRARKAAWTLPPLALLLAAMSQSINIGVRSVLPLAPFIALWVGVGLASVKRPLMRTMAHGLLVFSVLGGLSAYPHFLTYFNSLFGGTPAAHKWLADSNYDWGQDLPELKKAIDRWGIDELHLAYFGAGRPSHWNIPQRQSEGPTPGWHAVSRTFLTGLWPPNDPYAWLREIEPVELVGGSIALYQLDEDALPARTSAEDDLLRMKRAVDHLASEESKQAIEPLLEILAHAAPHYGALYQFAKALQNVNQTRAAHAMWRVFKKKAQNIDDTENLNYTVAQIKRLNPPHPVEISLRAGIDYLYKTQEPMLAAVSLIGVLADRPADYAAQYQLGRALEALGYNSPAVVAWTRFLVIAKMHGDTVSADNAKYMQHATNRIAELRGE